MEQESFKTDEETNEDKKNITEEIPEDEAFEEKTPQTPPFSHKKFQPNYRNDRYNNAYGNYSGGYGPPRGGYGYSYRPNFGGFPGLFGPPLFPPQGPRGPSFHGGPRNMWGRGFGPQGPPVPTRPYEDKTIRFLLRCGIAKEYLKNLPRDLLKLMVPGFCGLCSVNLDSFSTSRIHYISKNHTKNQKKWLNQQTDFLQSKEIPLKARELYCELCDVHITSKMHSDAHYAGKSHRAIVDGVKRPKNPILLQKGMESRVDHLIRREKRTLKPVEPKKFVKETSVQPELYCDICKASVTCSEQMTAHLNGKRHLSKEKQHILKMMKGASNEEHKDVVKVEVKDEDKGEIKTEKDEPENYDWGDGEGKWEENEKQSEFDWY